MDQLIPIWILGAPAVLVIATLLWTPKSARDGSFGETARSTHQS
jgi:hypothetical protein